MRELKIQIHPEIGIKQGMKNIKTVSEFKMK
ncbi:hypothetical protein GGQ94_002268 [Petrimonas sulfuriphila]|jgi:hypothetical protein